MIAMAMAMAMTMTITTIYYRRRNLEKELDKQQCSQDQREDALRELGAEESLYQRISRQKMSIDDYETIKIIGRGAFGEVRLCRSKVQKEQLYAVKILVKKEMTKKDQVAHVRSERDVMRAGTDNPWVVKLHFSFHDAEHLFLVMEFMPGGDMMTLLQREDTLSTDVTRFYVAEMVMAIDSIHKMGYTHRDIKPDNWMFDKSGHLALTDFGLCKSFQVPDLEDLHELQAVFSRVRATCFRHHASPLLDSTPNIKIKTLYPKSHTPHTAPHTPHTTHHTPHTTPKP